MAADAVADAGDDSPRTWAFRNRCGVNAVRDHLRIAGRKLHDARRGVGMSHPGVADEVGAMVAEGNRRSDEPLPLEDIVSDWGLTPEEALLAKEAREILRWAVEELPERLRLVAQAWLNADPSDTRHSTERASASAHRRTMEGVVAERMGVSRDEAKDLTDRALESLKHRLSWRGYTLEACMQYFAVTERGVAHVTRFAHKNRKRSDPLEDEDEDNDEDALESEEDDPQTNPC